MKKVTDRSILDRLEAERSENVSEDNAQSTNFNDFFKQALTNALGRGISDISRQTSQTAFPEFFQNYASGAGEGGASSIYSGSRGLSQLFGSDYLPEMEMPDAASFSQILGRGTGKALGYGALATPFIAGGEAALPSSIPALLRTLGTSAAAGLSLTPGDSVERLLGAAEFAVPAAVIKALQPVAKLTGKGLQGIIANPNAKVTYTKLVNNYDRVQSKLGDIFSFVEKQAKERGVNTVGELNPDIFQMAQEFGPKTPSFRRTMENAAKGDYAAVRRMYSKIGEASRKASKSNDFEKKDVLDEIQMMMNEGLEEHFLNTGQKDLAQWLNAAKSGYRELKTVFESPHELEIRRLVQENRNFPSSFDVLRGDRKSLTRLLEANPDVAMDVENFINKEEFLKALKKAAKIGGGALAITGLSEFLGRNNNRYE